MVHFSAPKHWRGNVKRILDPLSMAAQLMRIPTPSPLDIARERERQKDKARRSTAESRVKNRDRMRAWRAAK